MIEIRRITAAHAGDVRLPNEPFPLFGRMIPLFDGEHWSYREELFAPEDVSEMCFPDEDYDFAAMDGEYLFLGAYEGGACVGLAVLQNQWYRHLYLYDLKVNAAHRGRGVGRALVGAAMEAAASLGKLGLYVIAQDNNLAACRFYLRQGFAIGGFNDRVYEGTSQEGKGDIYFYRRSSTAG